MIVVTPAMRRTVLVGTLPLMRTFWLRLFINDYEPVVSSGWDDFEEPHGSWYLPVLMDGWQTPFINAVQNGQVDEIIREYIAAGTLFDESVYGYYVTTSNNLLCWAERAPLGPYPMGEVGDKVSFLPRYESGALC